MVQGMRERRVLSILAALLASACLSCARQGTVHAANGAASRPDPLLGKWVMIADNGGGGNGTVADFRRDGTVLFSQNGKTSRGRYRRVPGKAFFEERMPELGKHGTNGNQAERQARDEVKKQFTKPGVEMIEFAGSDGKFMDYGGTLLTFDPDRRLLYNPITAVWCRPGEQARVKSALDTPPVSDCNCRRRTVST